MATLDKVSDYIAEARVLLQDTVSTAYRYSDAELISALNISMLEAYRIRADLFLTALDFTVPKVTAPTDPVPIELGYRSAFIYYMVGRAQLRDQEDTTD